MPVIGYYVIKNLLLWSFNKLILKNYRKLDIGIEIICFSVQQVIRIFCHAEYEIFVQLSQQITAEIQPRQYLILENGTLKIQQKICAFIRLGGDPFFQLLKGVLFLLVKVIINRDI